MTIDSNKSMLLVPGESRSEVYNAHPLVLDKQLFRTPVVEEALNPILHVIQHRKPGTCFVGEPRTGKTWTQTILQRVLPTVVPGVPIGHFEVVAHNNPNEQVFYSDLLLSMRHSIYTSHNVTKSRERLINAIEAACEDASVDTKRSGLYVQFIDEAQDLQEAEWTWLKGISNSLQKRGISFITISFAQPLTLEEKRAQFRSRNRMDLIGRFMLQVYALEGVRDQADATRILEQLDDPAVLAYPVGSGLSYSEFFCPEEYAKHWRMQKEAPALWAEFIKLQRAAGIVKPMSVGMQWFVSAVREWLDYRTAVFEGRVDGAPISWAEAVARSKYEFSLC